MDDLTGLPAGPLRETVMAAHNIVVNMAQVSAGNVDNHVAVHRETMRLIAVYTADKPDQPSPTHPPRPEPLQPGEGRREGWSLLIGDPNRNVIAGWTTEGTFHAWETMETITQVLVTALADAHSYRLPEDPRG